MTRRAMSPEDRARAEAARGFMPPDEGLALWEWADRADPALGPVLEVGAYCGKSSLYLGSAARDRDLLVFSVDHHRGSEENQAGWEHHEADLVDPATGRMDTLPVFRRTVEEAGLEGTVVAIVGNSPSVAAVWATPLSLLFIDGGHGVEPARADYEGWSPRVSVGGVLIIHDVFPDPAGGGRPPYEEIYQPALASGRFVEEAAVGSLRVLRRV